MNPADLAKPKPVSPRPEVKPKANPSPFEAAKVAEPKPTTPFKAVRKPTAVEANPFSAPQPVKDNALKPVRKPTAVEASPFAAPKPATPITEVK